MRDSKIPFSLFPHRLYLFPRQWKLVGARKQFMKGGEPCSNFSLLARTYLDIRCIWVYWNPPKKLVRKVPFGRSTMVDRDIRVGEAHPCDGVIGQYLYFFYRKCLLTVFLFVVSCSSCSRTPLLLPLVVAKSSLVIIRFRSVIKMFITHSQLAVNAQSLTLYKNSYPDPNSQIKSNRVTKTSASSVDRTIQWSQQAYPIT